MRDLNVQPSHRDVDGLLSKSASGDREASHRLFDLLYRELRQLASVEMGKESSDHTLQSTALVHEVWMKLMGGSTQFNWNDRTHFFSTAVQAMRQILVDAARRKQSQKRGGQFLKVPLKNEDAISIADEDLLALDEALDMLALEEPKISKLVSLRFFGGLTIAQAAHHLSVSESTADRYWAYGKAWLRDKLDPDFS